ncbi:MAG TPA: protein kinase [Acidimicrobiia bacterium]
MPPVVPRLEGQERYELRARLGVGGMAEVFAGYDRRLDRVVALKLLKTDLPDPRARERFEHEARAAAAFVHPNAVTVYDVGDGGGRPFLVMELVDGSDLATLLATRGALPVGQAMRVADQMLAALGAAHGRGLVHRDVKPANVLLARDGTVKLADFGIAKATADATAGLTLTGQVMGTPRYLAPEQAAGTGATHRSDLYAAGVVLYEMVAGEPPFTGDTPMALALAHQQAPVPPLAARRPEVPAALVATIGRALEKDPERRFPDADAMRAALRGAPAPETAAALTAPVTRTAVLPAASPARRRRSGWWIGAAVAALFATGIAVGLVLFDRDEGPTAASPGTEASTVPSEVSTTTTSPPPTTTAPPAPQTVGDLVALLAADPSAYGEKGPDLLDKLGKAATDGKEAAKLSEEVGKWMADGELDPEVGTLAQQLLAPLASAPTDDNGPPGDRGRGNGNDGDDGDD